MTKYILVSGGVVSGIGKGVIGMVHLQSLQDAIFASTPTMPPSSFLYGPAAQDGRYEGHVH